MTGFDPSTVEQYREYGYLAPVDFLTDAEAAHWRAVFEGFETNPDLVNLPRSIRQYMRSSAHLVMPQIHQILADPRLLDQVESLLGPNIMLYGADFFIKEANTPDFVTWHQDLTYWGLGETDNEVTAWVALSDANRLSGCMRFVPGSHPQSILQHEDSFSPDNLLSRGQQAKVQVDESTTVHAVLKPGQVSFHHGRILHASSPNRSSDRRIGIAARFITPDVKQTVADRDYALLMRGIDNTGNWINVAPPGRAFEPSALQLYEIVTADQKKALAQNAAEELSTHRSN